MKRFDVVVVGAGVVGASLARALRGLSVALVAGRRPGSISPVDGDDYDNRVYALSPGSVDFLRSLKAWESIGQDRVTPVFAMRVQGDAHGAALSLDAYRAGVAELAWIVEDRALQATLWNALDSQDRLEMFAPSECASVQIVDGQALVRLSDGSEIGADLVVGADGAESFVRSAAGIGARSDVYGQTALVANFACERSHRNVAWQWFQGGPVLALLPLPGARVSMVWSLPDEEAGRLIAMDPAGIAEEVATASAGVVGALRPISGVRTFPLRRVAAERMVVPHVALVGDAAHVIHPLAGQGLNLGLQDARVLAAVIAKRGPVRRSGDLALLRRYERERSEAILAMRSTVHGLQRLFASERRSMGRLRNLGLNLTDRLPVLKNALMRRALY